MEAIQLIREATKSTPAVKFALGVAGVAAAVALVTGVIKLEPEVAVFGTVIMFGLMFILLVFSAIARNSKHHIIQIFAYILTGFFVLMIMATTTLLFTCTFWQKPVPIRDLIQGRVLSHQIPQHTDSEIVNLLQRKKEEWVKRIFTAQSPNTNGIKESPLANDNTSQVWTTAQCLIGLFSSGMDLSNYKPKIKSAFDFIQRVRRNTPVEGWNYYGDDQHHTVTEIGAWVTIAHIESLDSKTKIWNEIEQEEILNRIVRDISEIAQRQDASGGWKPIKEGDSTYTRTYSTIMALWCLIEARKSPTVFRRIGKQYDESMLKGINWLHRTYRPNHGWVQNPNRGGQTEQLHGLTAQTLFVISRAEMIEDFANIRSEQIFKDAENEFVKSEILKTRTLENDGRIHDADVRFAGSNFMAEGSTFLWFPWTIAALTYLSTDTDISPSQRKAAVQMRSEIFNKNFDKLEKYVEDNTLMYMTAENLFCISFYLNKAESETKYTEIAK